jgi:hypothetical protein
MFLPKKYIFLILIMFFGAIHPLFSLAPPGSTIVNDDQHHSYAEHGRELYIAIKESLDSFPFSLIRPSPFSTAKTKDEQSRLYEGFGSIEHGALKGVISIILIQNDFFPNIRIMEHDYYLLCIDGEPHFAITPSGKILNAGPYRISGRDLPFFLNFIKHIGWHLSQAQKISQLAILIDNSL